MSMQKGDIILSINAGTLTHKVITTGQKLKFGTANDCVNIVHAAIAISNVAVFESVGQGIVLTADITAPTDNRTALVYRCSNNELAGVAATLAGEYYNNKTAGIVRGDYSKWQAAMSIVKKGITASLQQRIDTSVAISDASFCSQFVANAYEAANLVLSTLPDVSHQPRIFTTVPGAMTPCNLALECQNLVGVFKLTGMMGPLTAEASDVLGQLLH
jgi:hypothetical protein